MRYAHVIFASASLMSTALPSLSHLHTCGHTPAQRRDASLTASRTRSPRAAWRSRGRGGESERPS